MPEADSFFEDILQTWTASLRAHFAIAHESNYANRTFAFNTCEGPAHFIYK